MISNIRKREVAVESLFAEFTTKFDYIIKQKLTNGNRVEVLEKMRSLFYYEYDKWLTQWLNAAQNLSEEQRYEFATDNFFNNKEYFMKEIEKQFNTV